MIEVLITSTLDADAVRIQKKNPQNCVWIKITVFLGMTPFWYLPVRLHSVTSRKNIILTAMRTLAIMHMYVDAM